MIRKIIALFTACGIVAGSVAVFAEEALQNPEFEKRLEKIEALGVDFGDGVKEDDKITRADFAKTILSFAGVDVYETESDGFYDVDKDHPAFNEINISAGMGYTVGYPDGNFKPEQVISVNDAVKVFVNILGYEMSAQQNGGYPNGYISTASQLGLLDGVKTGSDDLTYGVLSKLIDNAFECNVYELSISGGTVSYNESEDKDALWKYHRIVKAKAVVTATGITGLSKESDKTFDSRYAKLNGEQVLVGTSGVEDYLGYAVEAYVYYDEDEDFGEVKYITPSNKNVSVTVDAENILSESSDFSAYKFVYETESGRTKSVNITSDTDVIYNGIAKPDYKKTDLIPDIGNVELIDNDGDGDVEVISIFKADPIIVVDYSVTSDDGIKIVDKKNSSNTYLYDDEYEDYVVYVNGEKNAPRGLAKNMVVLIGLNGDHSITYAFDNSISGKITSIGKDDSGKLEKIEIDGVEYNAAPGADAYNMKLNDVGIFRIDDKMNVYAFEKDTSEDDFQYGYMIAGYYDENEVPIVAAVKMLTANNKFERYNLTERLKFNGSTKDSDVVMNSLRYNSNPERDFEPQLLMYKLDEEGMICELHSVTEDGELQWEGRYYAMDPSNVPAEEYTGKAVGSKGFIDKEGKVYVTPNNSGYNYYADSWGNMWYQDDDTVFFNINDQNLEASYITQPLWAPNLKSYVHDLYNEGEDTHTIGAVVWKRTENALTLPEITTGIRPAIVKQVTTVLDEDDIPVKALVVEQTGKTSSIEWNEDAPQPLKDIFNSLNPGDIIYFELDSNGRITNLSRAFDITKFGHYGATGKTGEVHDKEGSNFFVEHRSQYIQVVEKLSNYFFRYKGYDETAGRLQLMNSSSPVYKMTVKGKKVTVETITWDDVQNGDDIFIYAGTNKIHTMIVIDKRS